MRKMHDLTEKEREWFTFLFYQKIDNVLPYGLSLDDRDSPLPWGKPWLFDGKRLLFGGTIEENVDGYIDSVKNDITKILYEE